MDSKQLKATIKEAQLGNQEARYQLVEYYKNYVLTIARRMISNKKHLFDDISSAGLFGLWKGILNVENFSGDNFHTFLVPYIRGEMINELKSDKYFVTPEQNRVRKHRNQETIEVKRIPIARDGESIGDINEDRILRQGWSKNIHYETPTTLERDVYEILISDEEKQVVDFRIKGFTIREVASEMNISKDAVSRILNKIKERFENRYGQF